jgi:hypothetical protein
MSCACLQPRKNLEVLVLNVASDPQEVGRIDEEDVVLGQLVETVEGNSLHVALDYLRELGDGGRASRLDLRVDCREAAGVGGIVLPISADALRNQVRGVPRADLDDVPGSAEADHGVEELGVHRSEEGILEEEFERSPGRGARQEVVLLLERGGELGEELQLAHLVEVDADALRGAVPELLAELARVGDGPGRIDERHVVAPSLPEREERLVLHEARGKYDRERPRECSPQEGRGARRADAERTGSASDARRGGGCFPRDLARLMPQESLPRARILVALGGRPTATAA